jgi:hypothetical protein
MRNIVLVPLLVLFCVLTAFSQELRTESVPLGDEFYSRMALKDGRRYVLVKFPEKYTTNDVEYEKGIQIGLVKALGCEIFTNLPECSPLVEKDLKQNVHYVDIEVPRKLRIVIFKLYISETSNIFEGMVLTVTERPKPDLIN